CLLAALRGRAPARRQGRAWWPALVGPPGGFPHRGPGSGQGPDGEEHGHRARRIEGWLRTQARAFAVRPRGVYERRRGVLSGLSAGTARPGRQPTGGKNRATAAGAPPRWG